MILRGIDRAAVFFEDDNRGVFLECLATAAAEECIAVHAYVMMTNHVHLLMTAARHDGVSAVMKRVGQRYIELNPVRASLVATPGDYPWSSYRANALGACDPLVMPHALYQELAGSAEARCAAYRSLFEDVLSADLLERLRDCTNGGFVLGSPKFEKQIAAMLGRRTWKESPGRPRKEPNLGGQRELAL